MVKPAMNAVKPVAPSRYIGSKTLQLKLPIMAMVVKMMDGQNAMLFMGVRSISGFSQRSWRRMNSATETAITTREIAATNVSSVSMTKPKLSDIKKTAESTTDTTSRCAS